MSLKRRIWWSFNGWHAPHSHLPFSKFSKSAIRYNLRRFIGQLYPMN